MKHTIYSFLCITMFITSIATLNPFCPLWYRVGILIYFLGLFTMMGIFAHKDEREKQKKRERRRRIRGAGPLEEHF